MVSGAVGGVQVAGWQLVVAPLICRLSAENSAGIILSEKFISASRWPASARVGLKL